MGALRLVARKLVEPRMISLSHGHGGTTTASLRRFSSSAASAEAEILVMEVDVKTEELTHLLRRIKHLHATKRCAMGQGHRDLLDVIERTRRPPRITDLFIALGLGTAVALLGDKARRTLFE